MMIGSEWKKILCDNCEWRWASIALQVEDKIQYSNSQNTHECTVQCEHFGGDKWQELIGKTRETLAESTSRLIILQHK